MVEWNVEEGFITIKLQFLSSKAPAPYAGPGRGAPESSAESETGPVSRVSVPCSSRCG